MYESGLLVHSILVIGLGFSIPLSDQSRDRYNIRVFWHRLGLLIRNDLMAFLRLLSYDELLG